MGNASPTLKDRSSAGWLESPVIYNENREEEDKGDKGPCQACVMMMFNINEEAVVRRNKKK